MEGVQWKFDVKVNEIDSFFNVYMSFNVGHILALYKEGIITWSIFASWFFNQTLSIYYIFF